MLLPGILRISVALLLVANAAPAQAQERHVYCYARSAATLDTSLTFVFASSRPERDIASRYREWLERSQRRSVLPPVCTANASWDAAFAAQYAFEEAEQRAGRKVVLDFFRH